MTDPNFFAVFKYQHSDRVTSTGKVWAAWWGLFAILAVGVFFLGPGGIVLTIAAAILLAIRWPKRAIYLGQRFFVCGNTVAYYKNVRKMALRPGNLTIFWGSEESFKLDEKLFPTGARKDHKIKANKAAKFRKVAARIIERVRVESPGVKLEGSGWSEIARIKDPK